jgi:4-amino-4-deoxy-L-arabinose transferase-like glycosyltransferase
MRQLVRHQLWITAAAALVFFTNLGATCLWDLDEALYTSIAREMWQRGDWVVPMYNGDMFPEKPPLMFWLMIGGFKLFGVTEFAARFSSAALGIGTALATYHLGRRLFRPEVGLWAGLIVASTIIFTVSARAATVDTALTFATTLVMLLFVIGRGTEGWRQEIGKQGSGEKTDAPRSTRYAPLVSWLTWASIYALAGVAMLGKGPVGMLLPIASLGLFLLIANQSAAAPSAASSSAAPLTWLGRLWAYVRALLRPFAPANFLHTLWQMRPLTALVVVGVVALPWYALVGLRTDGAWLTQFVEKFNLGPFVKPFLGHRGPFFYHFLAVLIGFFPWSVFLGQTVVHAIRQLRDRHPCQAAYVLLACWIGVFFVFWSACSTKLPHYVLPAYPALALLTAAFLDNWLSTATLTQRGWFRGAMATLIGAGVGMAVALPIVAAIFLPGEGLLGLVGLVLIAGGVVCLVCLEREQRQHMLAAFAVTSVLFITAIFGFAAVRVDRHQHSPALAAEIRKASAGPPQIAAYGFLQASMVFYAGGTVPCFDDAEHLRQFLSTAPQPYIFTTDQYEAEIQQQFPGQLGVLARRPRFLGRGEVLVLSRSANFAAAHFTSPHTAGKMPPADARER